ncbi:MAG TPA: transposase [Thermoleophilaceae bacterium]
MARLPRNETEAGVHHVYARGVEKRSIFLDDEDRREYVRLLHAVVHQFRWHCRAYCLMNNHVHLVIQTREPNLGRGIHMLHGLYAQIFNLKYGRVGHLFQGRFGSRRVRDELQLARATEYVLDNPVKAGLCTSRDEWAWSGELVSGVLRVRA